MSVLGIDTSNYTTSIAYFDGVGGVNCSKLLPVKQGELGLRQSDAVFAHIKSLPELSGRLFSDVRMDSVTAVGVSTRPRAVEGSYMPCFMVGYFDQRHIQGVRKQLGVRITHHKTGHVAAFHCTRAGADTDCRDSFPLDMGKQPAGKLRQAFDMCKYSIGLTKSQFALLDRQKPGAILTA